MDHRGRRRAHEFAMSKWFRRAIAGGAALVMTLLVLILIGSFVARAISVRRAERDFPAPGRLVETGGRLSHIHCTGTGSPTVLLESGLDARGSWSWEGIRDELSRHSRVCAYDRAGIVWSEPREGPRDADRIAAELRALLVAAGEEPPYVMVGHSLGGVLVRVYDDHYPGEAAGFVLVDASHPEQDARFPPEFRERIASAGSEPRWLFRIVAPFRILTGERPTPRTAYWWRSFPEGVLGEVAAADAIFERAARTGSLGDRPLVVLTASVLPAMPGISAEGNAAMRHVLLELQEELASLSTNADHRIVEGAGHYVHQDRPEIAVAAIRDVLAAVRNGAQVRSESPETGSERN